MTWIWQQIAAHILREVTFRKFILRIFRNNNFDWFGVNSSVFVELCVLWNLSLRVCVYCRCVPVNTDTIKQEAYRRKDKHGYRAHVSFAMSWNNQRNGRTYFIALEYKHGYNNQVQVKKGGTYSIVGRCKHGYKGLDQISLALSWKDQIKCCTLSLEWLSMVIRVMSALSCVVTTKIYFTSSVEFRHNKYEPYALESGSVFLCLAQK